MLPLYLQWTIINTGNAQSLMTSLEKTLAEQLNITDREIDSRKALLDFTPQDEQTLQSHKPFISKYIDAIVEDFYAKQIQVPEIALVIGDAETLRRLQSAMRRYILELFDGHYDANYVNKRLRIGKVHQRIGVSPKLYIAAIHLLQISLTTAITQYHPIEKSSFDPDRLNEAIRKLLMFDIQFVFDTYISSLVSEVDTAKNELRAYADSLEATVTERTQELEKISRTDALTNLFNQRAFYEYLRRDLNLAERYQEPLSLCYFDLNGFKKLNDSKGHKAGDDILVAVGKATQEAIRDTDIGCRYGGDEFCIILPRTALPEAKRLVKCFKQLVGKQNVSFSIGIADTGPESFEDADRLVGITDKLMYRSKAKPKKKAGFYITSSTSN